jgi:tetratricopeptide (TPR) repeat protein
MLAFLSELRRRKVFRVAAVYAAVAFVVWQAADIAFPALHLPAWTLTLVVVLAILGLPIALVLAWAFDVTPDGVRRTAAVAEGTASVRWNRRSATGALGVGILVGLVAVGAYTGIRGPASALRGDVSPTSVAVLPFAVRGSADLAYLREGMVSLLATKLDGVGELRSVDPHALLKRTEERRTYDPAEASGLAAELGAGLYILGDVVTIGGQLHLNAYLYQVDVPAPLAQAGVAGSTEDLFELVDRLALELLATRLRGPEGGLGRAADLTTHSLPALRAFLAGEQERRAFALSAAIEAYQRAAREDSTFALAHLRLASIGWVHEARPLMRSSLDAALRYQERLSPRDRSFLEAQASFLDAPRDTERLLRDFTVRYPDDVEGWSLLGDLLFHGSPWRGGSRSEGREALERALALDPDYVEPLVHSMDLAAMEGRYSDLLSIADRWESRIGPLAGSLAEFSHAAAVFRILARYGSDLEAERREALTELHALDDTTLDLALWLVRGFGPPDLLRVVLERRGERQVGLPGWPGIEAELHAMMALAEGRPQESLARMAEARVGDDAWFTVWEAWLGTLPFADLIEVDFVRVRAELQALPVDISPDPAWMAEVDWQTERLWVLGVLSVRLGDLPAADRYAGELARMAGTDAYGAAANIRGRGLRALIEHANGRPIQALRLLEQVEREMAALSIWGTGTSHPDFWFEAFLRGEILRELGRHDEALAFYPLDGYGTAVLVPISHLRAAAIRELEGDRERAMYHYEFVTLLWGNAEPALRPFVEEAEQRLTALRGG